jgi:hypothetical protein
MARALRNSLLLLALLASCLLPLNAWGHRDRTLATMSEFPYWNLGAGLIPCMAYGWPFNWAYRLDQPNPARRGWSFDTDALVIDGFVWCLLALPCLTPLIIAPLRRLHRAQLGLCPTCGYDLRASEGHCPECGRPITRKGSRRPNSLRLVHPDSAVSAGASHAREQMISEMRRRRGRRMWRWALTYVLASYLFWWPFFFCIDTWGLLRDGPPTMEPDRTGATGSPEGNGVNLYTGLMVGFSPVTVPLVVVTALFLLVAGVISHSPVCFESVPFWPVLKLAVATWGCVVLTGAMSLAVVGLWLALWARVRGLIGRAGGSG